MNAPLAINVQDAKLPQTYEAAKAALAKCADIDECKDWADKAAALASYAKQAENPELFNYARRIQVRAVHREGELLQEYDGKGRNQYTEDSGDAPTTQREAAEAAGISKDQQVTAVRIASVPKDIFDAVVESDDPPTITEIAEIGKLSRGAKESAAHAAAFSAVENYVQGDEPLTRKGLRKIIDDAVDDIMGGPPPKRQKTKSYLDDDPLADIWIDWVAAVEHISRLPDDISGLAERIPALHRKHLAEARTAIANLHTWINALAGATDDAA